MLILHLMVNFFYYFEEMVYPRKIKKKLLKVLK